MSVDREDYFCNNCHNEFVFDFNLNEGFGQEDIKYCPFCGASYENEMDIEELGFGDPSDYEEWGAVAQLGERLLCTQ